MIITVHYVDNEFVAFDENNNRITNRNILEQITFQPFPGYKGVLTFNIPTDDTVAPVVAPLVAPVVAPLESRS